MQKKTLWAGVVSGQIQFFPSNPQGNVTGLQGSRKFHATDECTLVDDNGTNILENTATGQGGQDDAGSLEQSEDNQGPTGGAAQTA